MAARIRSYGLWRSYNGILIGQSSRSGDEVLPDKCAIEHMLSDIIFSPYDVSTPEALNSALEIFSSEMLESLSLRLTKIFQDPLTSEFTPDALDEAWLIESFNIPNPFCLSPGLKYLSSSIHLSPYRITAEDGRYRFRLRAGISVPGMLIPRKPGLAPVCDAFVELSKHCSSDLSINDHRIIDAFLAKQKVDIEKRRSQEFMDELAFSLRVLAEIIGLATKPCPSDTGDLIEFYIDGEDESGIR